MLLNVFGMYFGDVLAWVGLMHCILPGVVEGAECVC